MSERWGVALVAGLFLIFGVALDLTTELARQALDRLPGGGAPFWLMIPHAMAVVQIVLSGVVFLKAAFNDLDGDRA